MKRARQILLALALGATLPGGLACFSDPINHPPVVTVDKPQTFVKGAPATFTATVVDPDADVYTLGWAVRDGSCPNPGDHTTWPAATEADPLMVDATRTVSRFCVWAIATDRYGAQGVGNRTIDPGPPSAVIDLLAPDRSDHYPLYTLFELTSRNSTDREGDGVTTAWLLTQAPSGSTAVLTAGDCAMRAISAGEDDRCFVADRPGQYQVALTASEGDPAASADASTSTTTTATFDVLSDRLPYIEDASPPYGDGILPLVVSSGDPPSFSVSVSDDGDPWPASSTGRAHFTWFLSGPDGVLAPIEYDWYQFIVGINAFQPGDLVKVRVEVYDRNRDAIDQILLGCGDADLCAASPGHFLRVTWNVRWGG